MATHSPSKARPLPNRPPFDCIALVLQGGGALGAYQGGVYEALAEAGLHPDWVAGISIGAINAALIAGNPPEARVDKLREFWRQVTADHWFGRDGEVARLLPVGDAERSFVNQASAATALVAGAPGFFVPRGAVPWLYPDGTGEAISYYDTAPLEATLGRLVDFDRINAGDIRFSVGAVNVRSGNFVYFDTTTRTIGPEHVMASGALPPAFPAVEIEGEFYWDGGLVSNTPLQWVVGSRPSRDTLAFQVDLWSARGDLPRNMPAVMTRQKEIQFSSRTRAATDSFRYLKKLRCALSSLLEQLPEELKASEEAKLLRTAADRHVYSIIHLIYRAKNYEGHAKDYAFSRMTMEEHWRAGYNDALRTLRHPEVLQRPDDREGVFTFDLAVDGRE